MRRIVGICVLAGGLLAAPHADALDLPTLFGKPLSLELTEVTIVAQRFDSREVNPIVEGGGWGQWINRIQAKLDWNHFNFGIRLDSAVYWNTLSEQCGNPNHMALPTGYPNTVPAAAGNLLCGPSPNAQVKQTIYPAYLSDDLTRYQNSIYPAKVWGVYTNRKVGFEATVGDAYVQFARGLVLSLRKLDDLGIDTTVRGVKVTEAKGPFAVTLVAGMGNPSRVDEATGQALFPSKRVTDVNSPAYKPTLQQPSFGADQIFAAEIQAGRQSPVVATTSLSYVNRCAPNAYTMLGRVTDPSLWSDLVGYCDESNRSDWLGSIANIESTRAATGVSTVAESFELPHMGKFGSLYAAAAIQQRSGIDASGQTSHQGTAVYATYVLPVGKKFTATFEYKQYFNFYPTGAALNANPLPAFAIVAYSAVPTIESLTQDNLFGNFNACVIGGRARADWRASDHVLLYGQGIFQVTKGEQNAVCDAGGNMTGVPASGQAALTDYVADGLVGTQLDFGHEKTIFYATLGTRQDDLGTGQNFVHQWELTYTFNHKLAKRVAVEVTGRHRIRYELGQNVDAANVSREWVEGENYIGLDLPPHWVISQGFEYTTMNLAPYTTFAFINNYPSWLYLSIGGVYKFTKDSNLKVFFGQQRGGLKCVSGVCRIFPPFEGARAELTIRF